jgi:hypothetical protein
MHHLPHMLGQRKQVNLEDIRGKREEGFSRMKKKRAKFLILKKAVENLSR